MKEERNVAVIACRTMSGVSPEAVYSAAQPQLTTPSQFSFSVASTRQSSRPLIHIFSLILRFLAFIFSFISAFSLAAPSPKKKDGEHPSFQNYPELLYCFIASILVFAYSAYQLFKGVSDIVHRGIFISDMTSDYVSFILDQLAGYLLMSSSSVTVLAIQQLKRTASLWKASIVSVSMSFAAFLVIAACALLSGYKLCKRVMW
ncbi:hypothetical protein F0562_013273 [Nyssa sinensis]|uniref:CASP-like protein n=1 Tax=Nyssa sinensis TaxID=561372 RepID=A0A5J4ZX41_9ASTE|nr:hypothetical protein F0562_013273 [Nyssa sinensis]